MSVNGIGTAGYPAWRDMGKAQRNVSGIHPVQFTGVYVRLAENRLVFPVTAHDTVHDAVHAGVHELVQCRIFFQSNPSFRGVVAYLCFGWIASGKRKKPENHLVASGIF